MIFLLAVVLVYFSTSQFKTYVFKLTEFCLMIKIYKNVAKEFHKCLAM